MGSIRKGILGGFSGKVGPVVGASWRGMDVLRSLPKKSKRAATEEQLIQRSKFTLVAHFLRAIKPVISQFYGYNSGNKSKANKAMSYHIKDAIVGNYPDYTIDYPKVIISQGELLGPQAAVVSTAPNGKLNFNWQNNSGQSTAEATDNLVIVLYEQSHNTFEYALQAAKRSQMSYVMTLPAYYIGLTLQCWITFVSEDGKTAANSVYLGELEVE